MSLSKNVAPKFFNVLYVEPKNMCSNKVFYKALALFLLHQVRPWPIHISIGVMSRNAEDDIMAINSDSPIGILFKTLGRGYPGLVVSLHIVDGWEQRDNFTFEGQDRLDAVVAYFVALQKFLKRNDLIQLSGLTFGEGFGGRNEALGVPEDDSLSNVIRVRIAQALVDNGISDFDCDQLLIGASPGGAGGINEWYRQFYHWDGDDPRGNLWLKYRNNPRALFHAIMSDDRARRVIYNEDPLWLCDDHTWGFHSSHVSPSELSNRVFMFAFDVPKQSRLVSWSLEGLRSFCEFINSQGEERKTALYLGFSEREGLSLRDSVSARNRWFVLNQFGNLFGPQGTRRMRWTRVGEDQYSDGERILSADDYSLSEMETILLGPVVFPQSAVAAPPPAPTQPSHPMSPPCSVGAPPVAMAAPLPVEGGESESKSDSEQGRALSRRSLLDKFRVLFGPVGTSRGQFYRFSHDEFVRIDITYTAADFSAGDMAEILGRSPTSTSTFPDLFGPIGSRRGRYLRTKGDAFSRIVNHYQTCDFSVGDMCDILEGADGQEGTYVVGLLTMIREDFVNRELWSEVLMNPGSILPIVHRTSPVAPAALPLVANDEIIIPPVDQCNAARSNYTMCKIMLRLLQRGLAVGSLRYFVYASETCAPFSAAYVDRLIQLSHNFTRSIYKTKNDNRRADCLNGLMIEGRSIVAKKHSQWIGLSRRDAILLCLLESELDRLNEEVVMGRVGTPTQRAHWVPDEHLFGSVLQAFEDDHNRDSHHVHANITWADWSDENADSPALFNDLTRADFEAKKMEIHTDDPAVLYLHLRKIGTLI